MLAATWVAASPQAAGALEPGVHADPGSPAAKEYALPLNQARQTGSGGASKSEGTLFGAGITPPSSPGSPPAAGADRAARAPASGASGQQAGRQTGSPPTLAEAVVRGAREHQSQGGDGSLLALIGGGVAILVLAGFGGTVLRHSRRPTPSA